MFPDRAIDCDDLPAVRLKGGNDDVDSFLFDYEVKVLILDQLDPVGMSLASRELSFDRQAGFDLADISRRRLESRLYGR
jgi:hypothetical protein